MAGDKRMALEKLACEIANAWLRQQRDPRAVDKLDLILVSKLHELHRATRGDGRRCFCLAGRDSAGTVHSLSCPAKRVAGG